MVALPTSGELTGAVTNTHIAIKTAIAAQRDYLAGLLGTPGTIATALAALGVPFTQFITKSAAYTVVGGDRGDVISASGSWTLSLSAAASLGIGFNVILANAGVGTITIDPNGAELVDGAATITIPAGAASLLVCTGTAWISLPFQRPAQTSTADATANRLMFTGAFGLGGNAITTEDFDAIAADGFYRNATTACVGAPATATNYLLLHQQANTTTAAQLAIRGTVGNEMWYRRKSGGLWQPWVQAIDSANYPATLQSVGRFTSSNQTITLGGSLTIAHGLGARPFAVSASLECLTAEHGYAVGDSVYIALSNGTGSNGYTVSANDTANLRVIFGSTASFILNNLTTGAAATITPGNWRLKLRASL